MSVLVLAGAGFALLRMETHAAQPVPPLETEETSAMDPHKKVVKIHAPGIGLVRDGDLLLTRYRFVNR